MSVVIIFVAGTVLFLFLVSGYNLKREYDMSIKESRGKNEGNDEHS